MNTNKPASSYSVADRLQTSSTVADLSVVPLGESIYVPLSSKVCTNPKSDSVAHMPCSEISRPWSSSDKEMRIPTEYFMPKNMMAEVPTVHAKMASDPTICTPNCSPVLQAVFVLGCAAYCTLESVQKMPTAHSPYDRLGRAGGSPLPAAQPLGVGSMWCEALILGVKWIWCE